MGVQDVSQQLLGTFTTLFYELVHSLSDPFRNALKLNDPFVHLVIVDLAITDDVLAVDGDRCLHGMKLLDISFGMILDRLEHAT